MRSRAASAVLAAALAGSVVGCAGRGDRTAFTVEDSAGVAIAVTRMPQAPVWARTAAPLVVIGLEAAGDEPLFRVSEVKLGADGRVIVGHGGGREVRAYAADGTPLWTSGRDGQGPGEFRNLTRITLLDADSVAVLDAVSRRFTLLDPAGRFVSATSLTYAQPEPPRNAVWVPTLGVLGTTSDHRVFAILRMMGLTRGTPGPVPLNGTLAVFDPGGEVGDSVGALTVSRMWEDPSAMPEVSSNAFSVLLHPFVANDRLYTTTTDGWQVDVFDASGRRLRSIREIRPRLPLTDAVIDALPELPPGVSVSTHYPDSIPAIDGVVADRRGRVWAVARRALPADSTSVHVYDGEGRLIGTLGLPAHFQLSDVRGDRLVGVQRDSLDVETVAVYGFTPARP